MKPTVVLLPGLACDAALWHEQREALQDAGHTVAVSDAHARFDTLPEMAAAVLTEARGRLVLVGASMGGMVALRAVQAAPERVVGLALLGSTARPDTPEILKLRSDAIVLFEQGRMDEVLRANVPLAFHPVNARKPGLIAGYLDMIRRAGAAQLIRQNRAVMARPDMRPMLSGVRCRTLVVCGEADLLTPPDCSREIADAIPGARIELLPECGHMLTLEHPEFVNRLLLDWLASP